MYETLGTITINPGCNSIRRYIAKKSLRLFVTKNQIILNSMNRERAIRLARTSKIDGMMSGKP